MRRLIAWIAGAAGGLAAWRLLTRRAVPALEAPATEPETAPAAEPEADPGPDPRAEELRAKLAETGPPPAAEEPASPPEPAGDDPEERRRQVHEAGRAALEEMGGPE